MNHNSTKHESRFLPSIHSIFLVLIRRLTYCAFFLEIPSPCTELILKRSVFGKLKNVRKDWLKSLVPYLAN